MRCWWRSCRSMGGAVTSRLAQCLMVRFRSGRLRHWMRVSGRWLNAQFTSGARILLDAGCQVTEKGVLDATLLTEQRGVIELARQHVVQTTNSAATMLPWRAGLRIRREVLKEGRADYSERIVSTLSTRLVRQLPGRRVPGQDSRHKTAARAVAPFGTAGARTGRIGCLAAHVRA